MDLNAVWKIKLPASLAVFIVIGAGRWYNLYVIHKAGFDKALLTGIYFGVFAAVIALFIADLVLARGLLQFKIFSLKILFVVLLLVILCEKPVMNIFHMGFLVFLIVKAAVSIMIFTVLLIADAGRDGVDVFAGVKELPEKYLRKRPVKSFFEVLFRLFPNPEPTALYKIGDPGSGSPVFVTGNFELTIRRVAKALDGMDCWLLVCDSRGINIWCSTEAGHFGTKNIIQAIQRTGLAQIVSHKKIVLPQLSASNLSVDKIRSRTGFISTFGPLNIKNIDTYFKNPEDVDIRKATFILSERIEMSFGSPIILTSLLIMIFNFFGLFHLAVMLPVIYLYSFIHAMIFPKRFIKNVPLWALFVGVFVFAVNLLVSYLLHIDFMIDNIAISIGMAYLVIEFEGWSPLIKFAYGVYEKADISIDDDACIGCKACMEVCPKSVFEMKDGKAYAANVGACALCRACYVQCPVNAIDHSMDRQGEG